MSENVKFFPKYIVWLIIIGVSIFGFLQYINFLNNSDENSDISTIIKTPYILSIRPDSIGEKDKVTVSLNTLKESITNSSLSLFIVYPNSQYEKLSGLVGDQIFPSNSSNLPRGSYSVTLYNTSSNKEIISNNFSVSSYNWYNQVYDSLSVGNLTSLIPLLIPVIGFLYNLASKESEERQKKIEQEIADRNRILQDKSQWILKNVNPFLELIAYSRRIWRDCFNVKLNTNKGVKDYHVSIKNNDYVSLVYGIVQFFESNESFNKKITAYYFYDPRAVDFLTRTMREIYALHNILEQKFDIKSFFNRELKNDLEKDNSFKSLVDQYKTKLYIHDDEYGMPNICKLYLLHYTYGMVMDISVNNDLLITYPNPKLSVDIFSYRLNQNQITKEFFADAINYLNNRFYQKDELFYYRPVLGDRDLLHN